MTAQQQYWDAAHEGAYANSDWNVIPSIFATEVVGFLPSRGKVLDIGTGQGQDAAFFHSLGYDVVAMDISEKAIASAMARYPEIEFFRGDTTSLLFAPETFDVVFAHLSLHYFDHATTAQLFGRLHRFLRPGGVLATLANTVEDPEIGSDGFVKLEENFYRTADGIHKRYFSVESMRQCAERWFAPLLLDNLGRSRKDSISSLIRFVGRKPH